MSPTYDKTYRDTSDIVVPEKTNGQMKKQYGYKKTASTQDTDDLSWGGQKGKGGPKGAKGNKSKDEDEEDEEEEEEEPEERQQRPVPAAKKPNNPFLTKSDEYRNASKAADKSPVTI